MNPHFINNLSHGLHKLGVSGKTNDDKIWQWVQWINKRCAFTEHQQDYIYFAIRQILKSEACASGAMDTVAEGDGFYCADWNRCGAICDEQCPACKKAEMWEAPSGGQP